MPRILILEDNELIAMMLADWLGELGCDVLGPVSLVARALPLIDDHHLDGAVLDISVADGDCRVVAEVLQKRSIPFIFSTGGNDSITRIFQNAPVLTKPYEFDDVKAAIGRMLKG